MWSRSILKLWNFSSTPLFFNERIQKHLYKIKILIIIVTDKFYKIKPYQWIDQFYADYSFS